MPLANEEGRADEGGVVHLVGTIYGKAVTD